MKYPCFLLISLFKSLETAFLKLFIELDFATGIFSNLLFSIIFILPGYASNPCILLKFIEYNSSFNFGFSICLLFDNSLFESNVIFDI